MISLVRDATQVQDPLKTQAELSRSESFSSSFGPVPYVDLPILVYWFDGHCDVGFHPVLRLHRR